MYFWNENVIIFIGFIGYLNETDEIKNKINYYWERRVKLNFGYWKNVLKILLSNNIYIILKILINKIRAY